MAFIIILFVSIALLTLIIGKFINYKYKKELNNEDEKKEYLQNKYSKLVGTTSKFKDLDVEFERKVSEIIIYEPLDEKGNWSVYKRLKAPTWVSNDKDILLYEKTDKELEIEMNKKQ